MLVLGVRTLKGKCKPGVAGFFSMSGEEKRIFDERSFYRFLGKMLLYFAGAILFSIGEVIWPDIYLAAYSLFLIVAGLIFFIIYAYTGDRFRKKTQ